MVMILGEKKRQAFLDLLIESAENGVVLTDKEVREQVDTIMFEVSTTFQPTVVVVTNVVSSDRDTIQHRLAVVSSCV